ncbi:thiamine pyrophosphokinase [Mytilinidion resinicola]|uniref:Thiamine pyrophosphokinase n=1 Tax=Mytilinidion resinicola TaxID=574789 RepID=A0A6A6YNE0_9PEZI|nr:thiamine pyrophosphokinase [Mytilinidion resinicola]KAF2810058.1 thiamine pyrophosphokinase [Mytilinidion resinicola]
MILSLLTRLLPWASHEASTTTHNSNVTAIPNHSAAKFSAFKFVEEVDTWPYFQQDPSAYKKHMRDFYYFMVDGYSRPFGYMHREFIQGLSWSSEWKIDPDDRLLTLMSSDVEGRTKAMNETLRANYNEKRVVRKWFNENFALVAPNGDHVLDMDGGGVDLFGIVTCGVHMTGFVRTKSGLKYWVPRRSYTKTTFPGRLDNFVAGNLGSMEKPIDGMIREVFEETGIPKDYTRAHIKACGTLTYQMSVTNDGRPGCQHHSQYVYEMELSEDVVPRRHDGEVENFELMSLEDVQAALMRDEFTPNRTLTYVAHFIRHGIVTAENEARIVEICARLHRKHDLFIE